MSIRVEEVEGKGKGQICIKRIKKDELICEELAVAYAPYLLEGNKIPTKTNIENLNLKNFFCLECSKCIGECAKKYRCKDCKAVYFCSPVCLKKNMKNEHTKICDYLQRFSFILPPTSFVALQLIVKHDFLASLYGNASLQQEKEDYNLSEMFLHFFKGTEIEKNLTLEKLCKLFAKIRCNAFAVQNIDGKSIGTAIYSKEANRFNHSCLPNAHYFIQDRNIRIFALRNIVVGEEISIAYIDRMNPLKFRRKVFSFTNFECRCNICTTDIFDRCLVDLFCIQERCLQKKNKNIFFSDTNFSKMNFEKDFEELDEKEREEMEELYESSKSVTSINNREKVIHKISLFNKDQKIEGSINGNNENKINKENKFEIEKNDKNELKRQVDEENQKVNQNKSNNVQCKDNLSETNLTSKKNQKEIEIEKEEISKKNINKIKCQNIKMCIKEKNVKNNEKEDISAKEQKIEKDGFEEQLIKGFKDERSKSMEVNKISSIKKTKDYTKNVKLPVLIKTKNQTFYQCANCSTVYNEKIIKNIKQRLQRIFDITLHSYEYIYLDSHHDFISKCYSEAKELHIYCHPLNFHLSKTYVALFNLCLRLNDFKKIFEIGGSIQNILEKVRKKNESECMWFECNFSAVKCLVYKGNNFYKNELRINLEKILVYVSPDNPIVKNLQEILLMVE